MKKASIYSFFIVLFSVSAVAQTSAQKPTLKIDYEKFTLKNGLDVIFHVDKSDPVVAVNLTAHVGSAREKPGKTGFAHLFEHLLFLESENLGKGGLDVMSSKIGGSGANGSTSRDRTNYLQTVPNDALEKMIWAEADKLGWFINTVTEDVLSKEKQVVKNEKRENVDNEPYGHTNYVVNQNLYPAGHPYNWEVIGSLEDLDAATLDDVKEFFRNWYVPNNVTLVIAGDFDPVQARKWVEKYFNEIKRGPEIKKLAKMPGMVPQTKKLYHEDNFANLPELQFTWPTVEDYHPDSYALNVLAQYLSDGKNAPFYKVIVEDKKLSSNVNMSGYHSEIAGQFSINITAFPEKDLDEVASAIQEAFLKFEKEGIPQKDLSRIIAGAETSFYASLSSVIGKSARLAEYNYLIGDPGFIEQDLKNTVSVTIADVMRVYEKYIKGKNYIATSFVPKGQIALALEGSTKANVVEEPIVQGAEQEVNASAVATYTKTPSTFDRSIEPPYGKAPEVKTPSVWTDKLSNGIQVYGIENSEVPLISYNITIDGGLLLEDINKTGVSNLLAIMLTQGTKNKTPIQLEEEIEQLGASISVSGGKEGISFSVNALTRNYAATLALVEEMLLEPRWDEKEFARVKQSIINRIHMMSANPGSITSNEFAKIVYGNNNILAKSNLGTSESVAAITMEDLKAYYAKNISPSVARMHFVGSLDKATINKSLAGLSAKWKNIPVTIPTPEKPTKPTKAQVYFYDVPDAKQTVINVGYPALAATDADHYPATVMNYILGGGGFASQLTQELRESKGYTYGVGSGFGGSNYPGTFEINTNVRTNVTLESAQAIKNILENFGKNYNSKDLETTQGFLIKSNARAFETSGSKMNILSNISKYNWKPDYVKERENIVKNMTVSKIKALADQYLDPNKMYWLFVGDAKTQLPRLKELGYGEPILLNK